MRDVFRFFCEAFVLAVALWTCAAVMEHHAKRPVLVAKAEK